MGTFRADLLAVGGIALTLLVLGVLLVLAVAGAGLVLAVALAAVLAVVLVVVILVVVLVEHFSHLDSMSLVCAWRASLCLLENFFQKGLPICHKIWYTALSDLHNTVSERGAMLREMSLLRQS